VGGHFGGREGSMAYARTAPLHAAASAAAPASFPYAGDISNDRRGGRHLNLSSTANIWADVVDMVEHCEGGLWARRVAAANGRVSGRAWSEKRAARGDALPASPAFTAACLPASNLRHLQR